MSFTLSSTAVNGGILEDRFGQRGDTSEILQDIPQRSFPLEWTDVPEGTASFALVLMDYDNSAVEGYPFIHWLVADIPETDSGLAEDCSRKGGDFVQGTNSWASIYGPYPQIARELTLRYGGPAPGDEQHEYEVTLYALDCRLELPAGFRLNHLRKAMRGHILAESTMYVLY